MSNFEYGDVVVKKDYLYSSYIVLHSGKSSVAVISHNLEFLHGPYILNKKSLKKISHLDSDKLNELILLIKDNIDDNKLIKYIPNDIKNKAKESL